MKTETIVLLLQIFFFGGCNPSTSPSEGPRVLKRKPSILQLDPSTLTKAERIAVAMAIVESGGGQFTLGKSGEMKNSAWQYMPSTWNSISTAYNRAVLGGNSPLPMNRSNEELVTIWKVQQLLDRGYSVEEIGRIWNSSLGGSEKPLKKIGSKNKSGVAFNSLTHGEKVRKAYQSL